MQGGEHPLAVVGEPFGAVFELLAGVGGGGCAEHVTSGQFAMPAAQPIQALFLFFQFGQGELADADLLVDFGVEFGAVGDEFGPLLGPLGGEQRLQPGCAEAALATYPVMVGGGTPFCTALDSWVNLNLVETRTFPGGVVLTRYETRR